MNVATAVHKFFSSSAMLMVLVLANPWPTLAVQQGTQPSERPASLERQIARAQQELGPLPEFRGQVAKFYTEVGDQPAWLDGVHLTPEGRELIAQFESAAQKGLRPQDYGDWQVMLKQLGAAKTEQQRFGVDVALTAAAMRYVSDLHFGRVSPQAVGFVLGTRARNFSVADFLASKVVHAQNVGQAIAEVEPKFAEYWRLLAVLDRYESLAAGGPKYKPLPVPKKSVHPGGTYAALPDLVARLHRLDDLPLNATLPADRTKYEGAIVPAVERFQQRHGLAVDGILGRATLTALNVPLSHRIEQLEFALERWRWLPQHLTLPLIVVNIPEFRFYVLGRDYQWLMEQKVIVGRAYHHKTPVFIAQMQSVIFRPYWNVPYSIQRRELVPHIARDRGYLSRNRYEIVNRANRPVNANASSPSVLAQLRRGALKIRQLPGVKNSLGLVKFEFPNRYDVYMHGTPAIALFARTRRDLSHGCIRVEHPGELAAWVLRNVPAWTPEKIEAAMHGTETVTVTLPHPLTVVILYGTAVVTHDAEVRFLTDIYGYDAKLKRTLAGPRKRITAGP